MAIVVSHDEAFLDSVVTDVFELRSTLAGQAKSSLEHYSGDYSDFQNTLQERRVAQARAREAYEREKDKLKEFISREGKKYDNPAHQAQKKMKMKQLQQLAEVEEVEEDADLVLTFPRPYGVFDASEKLLSVSDVSFAWPGCEPLFEVSPCLSSPLPPRSRSFLTLALSHSPSLPLSLSPSLPLSLSPSLPLPFSP
jgi:ATPase subunit of ABC transporter with duplicated ATPase domains